MVVHGEPNNVNDPFIALSNPSILAGANQTLNNTVEAEATIDLGKDLGIAFDGDDDFWWISFAKHIAK
ncbi:hypothetical protein GH714_017833 [Hevea brasiliensis]|uniref:Uncharacterized protein n=1 Tax=Hevea brasiliensis TaxID=3981 RepID=A0A6A6KES5_HEVBR|nr:hypothetical protein GH714_017833 [Hevea brasiliensis]